LYAIIDKPPPNYTFLEKFITQIIKNVQVKITDIHIRYEDEVTKPERPFSMGITLIICLYTQQIKTGKHVLYTMRLP